jgi:hypothetical protein
VRNFATASEQRRQEGVGVRQYIGMLHRLLGREPEHFVYFLRIRGKRQRFDLSQPAPQGELAFAKGMTPDALPRGNVSAEFFAHFADGGVKLTLAVVNPAARKTHP